MNVSPGTRFGPYEVVSAVGAGGMGEVYRARDTRLDRSVAIKFLSRDLAQNPDFRARFDREARTISSLSHPNICTLYDVGEQDGTSYLVMEYVDGESLADRLERGPLLPQQVVKLGIEIADALERAHRAGVIHRDLKPGNIMLTKAGAKLLDFGLAKPAAAAVSGATAVLSSLTMAKPLTTEGTIVGTFQYMAPEQIEGKEADARSDIFALGALLYEAATAKKAFAGRTQASVIASVLAAEPEPMAQVAPLTPPALERVIKVCLSKDPDERFQTAHDLKVQLKWISDGSAVTGVPQSSVRRLTTQHKWERVVLAAACLVLAATTAFFAVRWWSARNAPQQSYRFLVPPQENLQYGRAMAFSPDGSILAFTGEDQTGIRRIWLRRIDNERAEPLAGTEDAEFPFWAPDSKRLAFFSRNKLKTVTLNGGAVRELCDVAETRGGAWGAGDVILLTPNWQSPLYRISASGGKLERFTELHEGESSHRWPFFLPDGKHFTFYVRSFDKNIGGVFVGSLDGGPPKKIADATSYANFVEPGYLVYVTASSLLAQAFDAKKLELSGDAIHLADGIKLDPSVDGFASFTASLSGNVAWRSVPVDGVALQWVERSGKRLPSFGQAARYQEPMLSNDGGRLAICRDDDVMLMDLRSGAAERATFAGGYAPVFSPDDRKLLYSSQQKGSSDLYEIDIGRRSSPRLIFHSEATKSAGDWSRDGRYILWDNVDSAKRPDVYAMDLGSGKVFPVVETAYADGEGRFSPDVKWIAFSSDESGAKEVYVQEFPGGTGRTTISVGGGSEPMWVNGGKEIVYIAPDKTFMSVAMTFTGGVARPGKPTTLFRSDVVALADARNHYYPTADGRRFLILESPRENLTSPLHVITNLPTALRK